MGDLDLDVEAGEKRPDRVGDVGVADAGKQAEVDRRADVPGMTLAAALEPSSWSTATVVATKG